MSDPLTAEDWSRLLDYLEVNAPCDVDDVIAVLEVRAHRAEKRAATPGESRTLVEAVEREVRDLERPGGLHGYAKGYHDSPCSACGLLARLRAALAEVPVIPDELGAAWAEAEAALGPDQRLVMWQDRGRARYIQVLAPATTVTDDDGEPVDDVMSPVISILCDYPSKGLGDGPIVELRKLAARLSEPPQ